MAGKGIELFNDGEYWLAHEALEEAWLDEGGEARNLYKAILQAGVVYLFVERGNYRGALKVYGRCWRWLEAIPDRCKGLDIGQLKEDLKAVVGEVRRLGPDGLDGFDQSLLKPIKTT